MEVINKAWTANKRVEEEKEKSLGVKKGERLSNILQGKTPKQWLEEKGFVYHFDFGWVKKNRLDYCIQKGYVKSVFGGEGKPQRLVATTLGCDWNYLKYLAGDSDTITRKSTPQEQEEREKDAREREEKRANKAKWEAKPVKKSEEVQSIFGDMIE
jgi:hypothetical protein